MVLPLMILMRERERELGKKIENKLLIGREEGVFGLLTLCQSHAQVTCFENITVKSRKACHIRNSLWIVQPSEELMRARMEYHMDAKYNKDHSLRCKTCIRII